MVLDDLVDQRKSQADTAIDISPGLFAPGEDSKYAFNILRRNSDSGITDLNHDQSAEFFKTSDINPAIFFTLYSQ